jgi:hypothetical protein
MKSKIVITSIFRPTEAVEKFSQLDLYELVVVGDKKTPADWNYPNVKYLAVDSDETNEFSLSYVLPYNHYCRKMLGYLYAIQNGATSIIDTDDDNIPKENWSFPALEGEFDHYDEKKGFVNLYHHYTDQHIWPRGLPLQLINTRFSFENHRKENVKIGIWQGLADEDPDVDAIYRLTSDQPCYFLEKDPMVLGKGTLMPFNTQNTIIRKELFPLLYLPTYVTFRFTDILRGLIAQPIMWLFDYHLGFVNATVIQKRNLHDYVKDFISEIPMYEHTDSVIKIVSSVISRDKSISDNLLSAYTALKENHIVVEKELITLKAWLADLENITDSPIL